MRVGRITQLTNEPLQCSQGGIPFNKPHLDALGRRIDELEAENERLREAAELPDVGTAWCGDCGAELEMVRPGKHNSCAVCERIEELEAALRAYMAMTDAPPAIEAKARAALDKREWE